MKKTPPPSWAEQENTYLRRICMYLEIDPPEIIDGNGSIPVGHEILIRNLSRIENEVFRRASKGPDRWVLVKEGDDYHLADSYEAIDGSTIWSIQGRARSYETGKYLVAILNGPRVML